MRFLVVGGSSFIGAYTVQALLDRGHEVVATGRNPRFAEHFESMGVEYVTLDLSKPAGFAEVPVGRYDGVALIAALLPANSGADLDGVDNAADYIRVNTLATAELLEWSRKRGIPRIVAASSYADVRNRWSADTPITEEMPRDFEFTGDHAAYVISKNAMADLMRYYDEQHGMFNCVLRLPPVYGAGPHGSLLVNGERRLSGAALFVERAKAGLPITVFGDGTAARDIVYVKDVAQAFALALESENARGLYNVGSGTPTTLLEQAEAISEAFAGPNGRSEVSADVSRENSVVSYGMDISKAKRELGYTPEYASFLDMMRDWRREEERGVYPGLFSAQIKTDE